MIRIIDEGDFVFLCFPFKEREKKRVANFCWFYFTKFSSYYKWDYNKLPLCVCVCFVIIIKLYVIVDAGAFRDA